MTDHVIETAEQLRSSYGEPSERAARKSLDRLDRHCRRFIDLSPFVVLASAGSDGRVDCSPRGDPAGFVAVLDDRTVLLPDRLGNNRVDSLRNVLESPYVGLLFLIPGVDETLRLNGRASLTTDPNLLEPLSVKGPGAAQRPRDRSGGGLPPVHQGARALPAVGGRVAGGPQGGAAFVRTDARRPRRPARRRGGGARGSGQDPQDDVLIRAPPKVRGCVVVVHCSRPVSRFGNASSSSACPPNRSRDPDRAHSDTETNPEPR